MQAVRPTVIEAALLYHDYVPFKYSDFVERLQLTLGEKFPVGLGVHEDGAFGIMKVGGIMVKLSQNTEPLAPDGFQAALSSPYMRLHQPEAARIVKSHRKNIFLTIGDESIVMPQFDAGTFSAEFEKIIEETRPKVEIPDIAQFSNRVFLARLIISQLIHMNPPGIIHWCQSDQFFKPEQMIISDNPRGMDVQIHPSLFASGATENGSQKIGFHAFGAEHLTGYHVIVEETAFALARVLELVNNFIYSLHKSQTPPADGTLVRMKSGGAMRVTMAAADNVHPRPYLRLEIVELARIRTEPLGEMAATPHTPEPPQETATSAPSSEPPAVEETSRAVSDPEPEPKTVQRRGEPAHQPRLLQYLTRDQHQKMQTSQSRERPTARPMAERQSQVDDHKTRAARALDDMEPQHTTTPPAGMKRYGAQRPPEGLVEGVASRAKDVVGRGVRNVALIALALGLYAGMSNVLPDMGFMELTSFSSKMNTSP